MPGTTSLFHPSGGLRYHLRALRYRDGLWRPYRRAVASWLEDWRPPPKHLVLVGPSGGYTLTEAFLACFARVTVLEPDPLARAVLRRRFTGVVFDRAEPLRDPADLPRRFPDAAFLFCNLLGQAWQGLPASQSVQPAEVVKALAGRDWASYHDVVSTRRPADAEGPVELDRLPTLEALLGRFWRGGALEIVDHGTHGLCPEWRRAYVVWPLTPRQHQLVEWLASGACAA
ncbi:MAG: hypothetical protein MUC79_12740 [Thiobacillaceae bacterium]|jgi:hypothetical protein|nr:hypothetical protein [Thiobacillaceae bacterium]